MTVIQYRETAFLTSFVRLRGAGKAEYIQDLKAVNNSFNDRPLFSLDQLCILRSSGLVNAPCSICVAPYSRREKIRCVRKRYIELLALRRSIPIDRLQSPFCTSLSLSHASKDLCGRLNLSLHPKRRYFHVYAVQSKVVMHSSIYRALI